MNLRIFGVLACFALAACGSTKQIENVPQLYTKPVLDVQDPTPVTQESVSIQAVQDAKGDVLFQMSADALKALQDNEKALRDYILKEKAIIQTYKKYYSSDDASAPKTP